MFPGGTHMLACHSSDTCPLSALTFLDARTTWHVVGEDATLHAGLRIAVNY